MIVYHSELKNILDTLDTPVYYENFNKAKQIPCITYFEVLNQDYLNGDTLAYSQLAFQVKVWGTSLSQVLPIAANIDTLLKPYGFTRTFAIDSIDNGLCVKTLRFNATGIERQ